MKVSARLAECALVGVTAQVEDEIRRAGIFLRSNFCPRRVSVVELQPSPHDNFRQLASGSASLRFQFFNFCFKFRRGQHRMPAVAIFQHSIRRGSTVAANPDRRALWTRQEDERRKFHERAVVGAGHVGAEQVMKHRQRFIGNRTALSNVGAKRRELRFHPADADAEDHTIARQFLDRRDLLCRQHGGAIGDD